jgi:GLPGLI family protein
MKWALVNDTMTIMGYPCFKATTKYRGRNYTAWYTTEIPMSYGPLKFGGLPGLIINLSEEKAIFNLNAELSSSLKTKHQLFLKERSIKKLQERSIESLFI